MKASCSIARWIAVIAVLAGCNALTPTPAKVPATPTLLTQAMTAAPTLSATGAPTLSATGAPTPAQTPRSTRTPLFDLAVVGKIDRDVTFCTAEGVALKMDLYHPLLTSSGLAPVVVNVHGGSWMGGDKARSETLADIPELVNRGYLVAAVNYRLAPKYKFPAQIEDVKCAVRYLRANAATYHLDPNRIGALGCSAGGHLVAMLGLTDGRAEFEGKGDYLTQSSRVQAVVAMSAPADFSLASYNRTHAQIFANVFGATSSTDPILTRDSPVTYVSKNAPPFFIVGGDKDQTVPPQQSQVLYSRLIDVGASASLQIVKNAHHCLPDPTQTMEPSRATMTLMIADFFDRVLR